MSPGYRGNRWGASGGAPRRKRAPTVFEKQTGRLDRYFSEYIRLSAIDDNGECKCFTCGKLIPWNTHLSGAGHFIGKGKSTFRVRWDERNVKIQCFQCNSNMEGVKWEFGKRLNLLYGPGTADHLQIKATKSFNPMLFDMEKKVEYYRFRVNVLKKEKLNRVNMKLDL